MTVASFAEPSPSPWESGGGVGSPLAVGDSLADAAYDASAAALALVCVRTRYSPALTRLSRSSLVGWPAAPSLDSVVPSGRTTSSWVNPLAPRAVALHQQVAGLRDLQDELVARRRLAGPCSERVGHDDAVAGSRSAPRHAGLCQRHLAAIWGRRDGRRCEGDRHQGGGEQSREHESRQRSAAATSRGALGSRRRRPRGKPVLARDRLSVSACRA